MTKNTEHVIHIHSKQVIDNKPKLPTQDKLAEGEIAVNYAEDVETLSIKNESGTVVTFSSDNYYTEQKLGSAFTDNDVTVTEVIEENERVTSAALNDLNESKADLSAFTEHTASTVHMTETEKINLDSLATNIGTISGITADDIEAWNAAASQDLTQYYKKTETSGKTELETAFSAKADNSDLTTLSGTVTAHTANADIHVTSGDKTAWNAKADLSDIPSVSGYADAVKYNNTTHYVEFYHGTTAGTKVFEYDASPFIIDGMVDSVTLESKSGTTYLVVTWNTAAGKTKTELNIGDIFEADNYYTKSETSGATELSTEFALYTKKRDVDQTIDSTTSASTNPVATKAVYDYVSDIEFVVSTALNDLEANKLDTSAFTEHMEETLVAAITDVNSRAADKEELKALVNDYQDFKLMYENRRERKRFTNKDDFVARLKLAVADQNLERYGLKVGDYYSTTNGGKTYNYVIAGLNTMKGTSSPYRLTTDHVGIIVDTNDTHAWNTAGNTYTSQNSYSTGGTWTTGSSAAGYANCDLHYYLTTTVLPYVKADLGSDNIKSHYKLYSNAVNTSGYNRFGSAGGCSSSWSWYVNQEICALSEVQVYGSIVWSSSGYDTGEACRQLDVFRVYNMNEIFEGRYPWLRDVASASNACVVNGNGGADSSTASYAIYVAALILFA